MADCKELEKALADLNRKVEAQNKLIQQLQTQLNQCCGSNKKPSNNNDLEKRVAALEKTVEALKIGLIKTLENFADIENTNRTFTEAFNGLYELIQPLFEFISDIVNFFGGDDDG